ncbi:hypothetical protein D3C76_1404930 [compost metagenome]
MSKTFKYRALASTVMCLCNAAQALEQVWLVDGWTVQPSLELGTGLIYHKNQAF